MQPNINWQPEILEDDLIKLIPLKESDFNKLFAVASDPLIWEQHPTADRYRKEIFQVYFDGAVKSKFAFIIIDIKTGEYIGSTRYYDFKPESSSIAIGWTFLARKYWGGEYNKSAKKLLLHYAFQFVDNVYFHIGSSNIRSQKGTMKIGAKKVGEVTLDDNGKPLIHFEYLIRKEEWEKI